MGIYGLRAFAAAGVAVAALSGGALMAAVSASAPPTRAVCATPESAAVSDLGLRQAEFIQVLTPGGSSLISSGSRGLVALRESLRDALCAEQAADQPAPAVPIVAEAVSQAPSPYGKWAKSPSCRIV